MDRIELYRIFARVVETRSFTKAADSLRMPRSSVSAAIAELEARLGTKLLHRTTRVVAPSREGAEFYDRCRTLIADTEELEALFRTASRQPQGPLRIDVPGRIGRLIVAPALSAFLERYPGITLELGASDLAIDLIAERVDCALRVGTVSGPGLRARRIGELPLINVASPAYFDRHGIPLTPGDLDGHFCVAYASPTSGRVVDWEWVESGHTLSRTLPYRVAANSAETYIACALAGLGLIQVPAYDVADQIASGALVEVMSGFRAEPMPVSLLFPRHERPPRRVALVADWLEKLVLSAAGMR